MAMNLLYSLIHRVTGHWPGCPPEEDLFEFTLDGLGQDRGQAVREHLGKCSGCREQIKEFAWVNEGIALSAPLVEAPEGLCDKVKERIRQDPEQTPPNIRYIPAGPRLDGWPVFWMRLGPVFALTSLLMSLVALGALMSKGGAPAKPLLSKAEALLGSPVARSISLKAEGKAACAGRVVMAEGMDSMLIQVENLAPCPHGRVYTVWMCHEGGANCRLAGFQTEDLKQSEYLLHLSSPLKLSKGRNEIRVMLGQSGAGATKMDGEVHLKGQVDL